MDWQNILGLILGNAAFILPLFLWNRAESRADYRHLESSLSGIREEMKDFHGRLCVLEERFINWLTREK